jgi:translocation and assembly module TamB
LSDHKPEEPLNENHHGIWESEPDESSESSSAPAQGGIWESNPPVATEPGGNGDDGRRRSLTGKIFRGVAWFFVSLALLLLILFTGFAYYSTTADFQHRVGTQVVGVLETATGGKVDLGGLKFDLFHLAIEVDGLVIHGLEGPGQAPYLAADKILVRIKIVSLFHHLAGNMASHIGLSLLRVESPHVHLIIDKDGKTNQPVPAHPTQSNEPVIDTLLDLKAADVQLLNGVALVNDRAIPFNLAAQDLNAQINYLATTDRYGATVDLRNLRTQIAREPEAKSSLHLETEIGRDTVLLKSFDFHSGDHSEVQASGAVKDFKTPEWQAQVNGSLDLKQISILGGVPGLDSGSVELNVGGHSCFVEPAQAQKKPSFFQRELRRHAAKAPLNKTLPPDPDCKAGYLLVGMAKLHDATYRDQYVNVHDINGGAQLHVTPTQLLFTALTGYLAGGGSASGELKIDNWLGEVATGAPTTSPTVKGADTTANKTAVAITGKAVVSNASSVTPERAHAYLTVKADHIKLATILDITAVKQYRDLGFDTSISGPVKAEWGGPATDIADSVLVDADLSLAPTGYRGTSGRDLPVSGQVLGHYDGRSETVSIQRVALNTPESSVVASGTLGVNAGDPLTNLHVNLNIRSLAEYDQLLLSLGLSGNGKKGAAAIPIALHGSAQFEGTARGPIANLDIGGHLQASDLDVRLGDFEPTPAASVAKPPKTLLALATETNASRPSEVAAASAPATDIHIDSLVADAEYTSAGLAVGSSTITQGSAVLHVAGSFRPREVIRHKTKTYVWDDGTAIDAQVQLGNADVNDLLTIAGQQQKIPVTGTISANGQVVGTLANLHGGGAVTLVNGVAYGEPYDSASVNLTVLGREIEASQVTVKLHGYTITANGGYNLTTQRLHAHLQGDNLRLSKFATVQNAKVNADGVLSIDADANGTLEQPGLKASVKLADVVVEGKPIGSANINAYSQGSNLFYNLTSTLIGTNVAASGETNLTGDLQTQAKLTIANFDVGKPLALFEPGGLQARSDITGVITLNGPAKFPEKLAGSGEFSNFAVTAQGLTFKAAEPLVVGLRDGLATIDRVHIVGPDTDVRVGGNARIFGAVDPKTKEPSMKAGLLNVNATGSISMALASTFDSDLITSGKVVFAVGATGTIGDPQLTGKVTLQNVNLAVDGIANGLSNMNGTLVFNQDRLNVQSLVATTGGGQLKIGGFLTYRNGLFADLTATGDTVRVRYNGLSATANASLRLQGQLQSARLSGNILLTRFGIGADVDFAAFAGAGGVQAPPDPSSPANKIQLDVHVTSSPQLDFQNSYAKLAGTVDLTVHGTVAEPTVLGRIQITDGSATFAGTKYELQRGEVYFTNPVRIDPQIDLDATARVENYDVTIGLHGTAENLKPTYRSSPPLSEADIFALLALGRTQEEAQIYQEQQVAAGTDPTTSSLLGGALNATVSSRVSKLFGVGSVKIDPSYVGSLGNSSARITVQQQLSRQITLTYATNVNSSAQQLIQLTYQLSPNVSIVAARDESGVFSIVYKIRHRSR